MTGGGTDHPVEALHELERTIYLVEAAGLAAEGVTANAREASALVSLLDLITKKLWDVHSSLQRPAAKAD